MANENKKTFLDFLKILTRWRKSLLLNFILVGIISVVISLLLPKWYKASSLVMAPQTGASSMGGLSALMSNLPLGGLGLSAGSGNEMVYMAILKSRTMADSVISEFDLQEFYENQTMEQTYLSFYNDYEVMLTEENMISISFEHQDSVEVAKIVNFITTELKRKADALFEERASKNKEFIEDRYFDNLQKIDSLQIEMEMLQNKYGVFELIEQTKSILASIADMEAQIILKRAELEAVKQTLGENTPQYKSAKIQLESLEKEVDKIKFSNKENLENPFGSVFLPLDKFPEISKKYTDIYTNLLLQQKLQEFLLPEYENAKMQLLKDKPVLQIIDYATPPDYKSRPKRAFVVLGALLVAFLIQLVYILMIERINWWQENDPDKYKDVIAIKRSWLRFFGKN